MLKQLSSFTLLILATSSLAIAGDNNPCNKYGWVGAKWICNGIWGNPSTVKQNLPDVKVPASVFQPEKKPVPIVKEESTTPVVPQTDEPPVIQPNREPVSEPIITNGFPYDAMGPWDEPRAIKTNEQSTMRTLKVEGYDAIVRAKKRTENKNALEKIITFTSLFSFTIMEHSSNPEVQKDGQSLRQAASKIPFTFDRAKERIELDFEIIKALFEELFK